MNLNLNAVAAECEAWRTRGWGRARVELGLRVEPGRRAKGDRQFGGTLKGDPRP